MKVSKEVWDVLLLIQNRLGHMNEAPRKLNDGRKIKNYSFIGVDDMKMIHEIHGDRETIRVIGNKDLSLPRMGVDETFEYYPKRG